MPRHQIVNKPLTRKFDTSPPKYFNSEAVGKKEKPGTKKYSKLLKKQKERELQEMILKNKMYPQKYQNTYFITDKEQIGLLYDDKPKKGNPKTKKKGRNQERLRNMQRADLADPQKLKQFLEEDRRITQQKKRKYLTNAKKRSKVGSKTNSIHVKFYKDGADKRIMMPKVHDNRIAMLMENEKKRMHKSARKIHELNRNFRENGEADHQDISEANRFYLSKGGFGFKGKKTSKEAK